jgi:hypothetical protein
VPTAQDILPKLGVPPFLLSPDFDARTDLPHLNYDDDASLLAEIRRRVHGAFSRKQLRKYDRNFDAVTWAIGIVHVALLGLLIARLIPGWAFVVGTVVTRTSLAGAGHYHLHRKWKQGQRGGGWFSVPLGKALFDINYVGTSLIGTDGHVLLHHPYLSSGADVKKTFFDSMLRLHPLLRVPGHTLHKLGIALTGLSLRGREIAKYERPKVDEKSDKPQVADSARTDFWIIRGWILIELGLCLGTGHIVAWLLQFFFTLWVNTFLVVASHDFEDSKSEEEEVAVIPEHLRNDWAARQICLSYDLSVVGNRWIDLFLSAGLSPHRVHHVFPWHGSGFANLATEAKVREVCEEVGITWERPRNLIFERFPAVIKHYLLHPVKADAAAGELAGPPPAGNMPMPPALGGQLPPHPAPGGQPPSGSALGGQMPPHPAPGGQPPARPAPDGQLPPHPRPSAGDGATAPMPSGQLLTLPRPPAGEMPPPPPPAQAPTPPRLSVGRQLGEFVRYAVDGFRGIGV